MVSDTQHPVEASARPRRVRRAWRLFATVLAASGLVVIGAWLYASPFLVFEQFKADAADGDLDGLRAWADSAVLDRLQAVTAAMRAAGGRFEAGYQSYRRFAVRLAGAPGGNHVTLVFRRDGAIWRLSDVQGLATEPVKPPEAASPPPVKFAALLGRVGMPASDFVALPEVRGPLEKLLASEAAAFAEGLGVGPGVQEQGNQIFLSGCSVDGCKASEAAMSFDAATGEVSATVLKDGKLTVYSEKVTVIEELPKAMQTWLDHLTADENASIPVSFRPPAP